MENRHTNQDLIQMQSLPLECKVNMTINRIRGWLDEYGSDGVYVSFSGGKDSTVLLDLVRSWDRSVPAVFADTGLEYPEIRDFVKTLDDVTWVKPKMNFKAVIEKYGYPVFSKNIARNVNYARKGSSWAVKVMQGINRDGTPSKFKERFIPYQYLLNAPFKISDQCCYVMKKDPIHRYERETGRKPILGTLAEESQLRQLSWLKHGCNSFDTGRSQPLSFWTNQDILEYIYTRKLRIAPVYGEVLPPDKTADKKHPELAKFRTTGCERTGCVFCLFGINQDKCPNRIQRLATTHPQLYNYCLKPTEDGGLGMAEVMDFIGKPYKIENNCINGGNHNDG